MSSLNFVDFFTDVYKYPPLPWQKRLAAKLVEDHSWPDLIDLPTASGKTACLDIALFHLAWCAERGEAWRAARRIVFVVDRRIIVDAAADRAAMLCAELEVQRTEAIRRVSVALKMLGGKNPLVCEKLRGGMPRERGIALNPAQPMIITSTVDQVGSRLLFRGYGLRGYAHPVHAGLLGSDTLLLVDEAHLSVPFIETVAAIRERQLRAERPLRFVQPVRIVPLSATAETEGTRFQLDAEDLANEQLAARRTAPKPARLVEAPVKFTERVKVLRREALDLYRSLPVQAPAVAVIVNRVRIARALHESLLSERDAGRFDVELMTGRSRPLDRDAVAARVMSRAAAGIASRNERGLIVVATQTIEVGANLDFHGLVTECAAMDALRQRFGRLDRLGNFRQARATIIGNGDRSIDDPVYGSALCETWTWLGSVAGQVAGERSIDFSIDSMGALTKGLDIRPMNSPLRERLPLTPVHIDLLSQTSPAPMVEPDVPALLHGLKSGAPDVQVVWRADLPVTSDLLLDVSELGVATALLEVNPPTSLEALALPLRDVRAWLQGRKDETDLADIEGALEGETPNDARAMLRPVLRRSADRWEPVFVDDVRPGDTLLVPAVYGGCDRFGFAPDYTDAVTDLSAAARDRLNKSSQVVITEQWLGSMGVEVDRRRSLWKVLEENQRGQVAPLVSFAVLLDEMSGLITPEYEWLRKSPAVDVVLKGDGHLHAIVATEGTVRAGDVSDEDLSSSYTIAIPLDQHNAGVARQARTLAEKLSLATEHVEHVACAGGFHDLGKADPRMQQILRSGDTRTLPGQLLAKGLRRSSRTRAEPAERHEAYSVDFLRRYPELLSAAADPELVLYLIGTHHGRGRALMPDCNDEGTAFALELAGRSYRYEGAPDLGALGSGWPALFWRVNRRYGPWGVAYLEAILRLADWLRSAEEVERGTPQ